MYLCDTLAQMLLMPIMVTVSLLNMLSNSKESSLRLLIPLLVVMSCTGVFSGSKTITDLIESGLIPPTFSGNNKELTPITTHIPILDTVSSIDKVSVYYSRYTDTHYRDDIKSCDITISEGKISIEKCKGLIVVESLMGVFNLTCHTIKNTKWAGPITVRHGPCIFTTLALGGCGFNPSQSHVEWADCNSKGQVSGVVLPVICAISTLLSLFFIRYWWVRTHTREEGFFVKSTSGGFFSYNKTLECKHPIAEWHGLLGEEKGESVSIQKGAIREVHFSATKIIILVMFCGLIKGVHSHIPGVEFGTFRMSDQDVLMGPGGAFYVKDAYQAFPLNFQYYTSRFQIDSKKEWYCRSSVCYEYPECIDILPRGVWANTTFDNDNDGSKYFTKKYCSKSGNTCMSGSGCWVWSLKYHVLPEDKNEVYAIDQSITKILIEDRNHGDATVVSAHIIDPFNPSGMSVLRSPMNVFYLCPFYPNTLTPRAGELGDLQYNDRGFFNFPKDVTSCRENWNDGPRCDSIDSFMKSMAKICKPFPVQQGSYHLEIKQGMIISKKDSNVAMTLYSTKLGNWTTSSSGCGEILKSVWGVKGDSSSYQLILKSSGCTVSDRKEVILPCTGETVVVDCDCKNHIFSVQNPTFCSESLNGINITEFDREEIDLMKANVVSGLDHNSDDNFYGIGDFWNQISSLSGIFSGVNIIIIIIIIFAVLKK